MASTAPSKVFMLDKYFYELERFWDTEKKQETDHRPVSSTGRTTQGDSSTSHKPGCQLPPTTKYKGHSKKDDNIDDLVHLCEPATEEVILSSLEKNFTANKYVTKIGPVLVTVNPFKKSSSLATPQPDPLANSYLLSVVHEALSQLETYGTPQTILLSGECGSGKTFTSMLLLRHLFDVAGGGPETDAYKHLSASLTVIRSLSFAGTQGNSESSRIGHFYEVQVTDGAIYRTKIQCYFLDQSRVVKPAYREKNFHIFYQLLAGLSGEEREKLSLGGYGVHNLNYLSSPGIDPSSLITPEDSIRFDAWKTSLSILGISFTDVVRVLAAVLLLGNLPLQDQSSETFFGKHQSMGYDVPGMSTFDAKKTTTNSELKAVASLLGVSFVSLFRALTTRTKNVNGQLIRSAVDSDTASYTRDALAKALYCRTVATIVRRANSLKRLGSSCGTLSSDSNESMHREVETGSRHASTVGSAGAKSHKSLNVLNCAIRHANTAFVGILDMFGFEDAKPSRLEQLCINLSAEAMQHYYNTNIFKLSVEYCREENISSNIDVTYIDNVPCIDFISSLRTGLLSILDAESTNNGSSESFVEKLRSQHSSTSRYFDVDLSSSQECSPKMFGIKHFAGDVIYDTTDFLACNRDSLSDDIVIIFHKTSCSFPFANHLFGMQLKTHFCHDLSPKGTPLRISPTHTIDPIATLTQDFHSRLDNLLRQVVGARPHFIRCIKSNSSQTPLTFDRQVVKRQIRALQILETVTFMAGGGFSARMKFRAFNSRYRCLASSKELERTEEKIMDDCRSILNSFSRSLNSDPNLTPSTAATCWAVGKKHIFMSEGARQQLESLRTRRRNSAARLIQSTWRGVRVRRKWASLKRNLLAQRALSRMSSHSRSATGTAIQLNGGRPRPQPIAGTPPPEGQCDHRVIEQTCSLFGLDLETPPPVPPSRSYTVTGNAKLGYPQVRLMKMDFPCSSSGIHPSSSGEEGCNSSSSEDGKRRLGSLSLEESKRRLLKGQSVTVVGAATRRGHLLVEFKGHQFQVPYQYLELPSNLMPPPPPPSNASIYGTGKNHKTCSNMSSVSTSSKNKENILKNAHSSR